MRLILHKKTLGEAIYNDIDSNIYLHEIYNNILFNYSIKLFKINDAEKKAINIEDALRFADLLSKSVSKQHADRHKILSQEIVALLNFIDPDNEEVKYYMGSVLSSIGNYRGLFIKSPEFLNTNFMDRLYIDYNKNYMAIPAEPSIQFFRSQKIIYSHFADPYFSYSGPTSMGKSFVMRMFIKQQIISGAAMNFILLVPTKALINELTSNVINDLKGLLVERNYRIVTSAGAIVLKQKHNFIFILTPERLLYLLIENPQISINYLFVDEAHKISTRDNRSTFYYKVVDMLVQQEKRPHVIFSSPNIPNPEIYLKLIPDAEKLNDRKLVSCFAPVSQIKYLIDFQNGDIKLFNSYSKEFLLVAKLKNKQVSFCDIISAIGGSSQNIIYCSSTSQAVELAINYARNKPEQTDNSLTMLAKDIKNEIHGDYYLAKILTKGISYHIGYLPATIRMRIEELFKEGLIKTMFCTSTLVEGVNLPADNLFITSYRNGIAQMTPVDFNNLIGRVGRIEYNLYGNVFLVCLPGSKNDKDKFVELLNKDVPAQQLSLVTELTVAQKKIIVECLCDGKIELERHPKNQTANSYALMRKFAIILLRDIMKDRNSIVKRAFEPYLTNGEAIKIKEVFNKSENKPDDDINVSVDQTNNLTNAISKGLCYPSLNQNGNFDYSALIRFLEKLCKIFKWEKYESKTLGKKSKNGQHNILKWYAVILSQWMQGSGLSFIIVKAIEYKQQHSSTGVMFKGKIIPYDNSLQHRNIVIAETLGVIENIILFSISNYFLRFTNEYKKYHQIQTLQNDWYEYVEYGTTNPLTIVLQRSGFSRETSTYIKKNRDEYVFTMKNGEKKIRKSILECHNQSVKREALEIQYNMPELFIS